MHKRRNRSTPRDLQYQPLRDLTFLHQYQQPRNLAFRRLRMSRLRPLADTNGNRSLNRFTTDDAP